MGPALPHTALSAVLSWPTVSKISHLPLTAIKINDISEQERKVNTKSQPRWFTIYK